MFKSLGNFLFGKKPDIFAPDGTVRHKLPKEKWDAWQARYLRGEDYNWRNHVGTRAPEKNHRSGPKN
jgi:hypothetical protein